MRRHAEIALHAVEGAVHALHAAHQSAREAMAVALSLRIAPAEAEAIRAATATHLVRIEEALLPLAQALHSAEKVKQAVEQAEISHFGLPVLPARAGT